MSYVRVNAPSGRVFEVTEKEAVTLTRTFEWTREGSE
jgi:hypothetical protein